MHGARQCGRETKARRACRRGYAVLSKGWLLAHATIGTGIWCPEHVPSCGPVCREPRDKAVERPTMSGGLSVRGAASALCAVVPRSGVRECLVGGSTIPSHSPAVNSEPDAARMCRRAKRCTWMLAVARTATARMRSVNGCLGMTMARSTSTVALPVTAWSTWRPTDRGVTISRHMIRRGIQAVQQGRAPWRASRAPLSTPRPRLSSPDYCTWTDTSSPVAIPARLALPISRPASNACLRHGATATMLGLYTSSVQHSPRSAPVPCLWL